MRNLKKARAARKTSAPRRRRRAAAKRPHSAAKRRRRVSRKRHHAPKAAAAPKKRRIRRKRAAAAAAPAVGKTRRRRKGKRHTHWHEVKPYTRKASVKRHSRRTNPLDTSPKGLVMGAGGAAGGFFGLGMAGDAIGNAAGNPTVGLAAKVGIGAIAAFLLRNKAPMLGYGLAAGGIGSAIYGAVKGSGSADAQALVATGAPNSGIRHQAAADFFKTLMPKSSRPDISIPPPSLVSTSNVSHGLTGAQMDAANKVLSPLGTKVGPGGVLFPSSVFHAVDYGAVDIPLGAVTDELSAVNLHFSAVEDELAAIEYGAVVETGEIWND